MFLFSHSIVLILYFFLFRIAVLPLSVDYLHLYAAENKKKFVPLCSYATWHHITHDVLLEQFFLNGICWKLFSLMDLQCSCCNIFRQW